MRRNPSPFIASQHTDTLFLDVEYCPFIADLIPYNKKYYCGAVLRCSET